MKYGRAFFKLCLILILCVGLGSSVAWAQENTAPTTLKCKQGDACNAVMEGWCYQNKKLLDEQFQGKILERHPFLYLDGVISHEFYVYVDPVDCTSQFCCFQQKEKQGLIGHFWDHLMKGQSVKDFEADMKKVYALLIEKHYSWPETIEKGYEDQVKQDIDKLDISDPLKQRLKEGVDKGDSPAKTMMDLASTLAPQAGNWLKNQWEGWKHLTGVSYDELVRTGKNLWQNMTDLLKGKTIQTPFILQAIFDKAHASVDCWLCPMVETIFISGNAYASLLYKKISKLLLAVLGIFAALTIMWMVFKVLVDFSGKESRSFIRKIFFLCLRIVIAAILIMQSPRVIGDLFFTPLIHLSSGLSMELMAGEGLKINHAHINYFRENFDKENNILGCTHTNPQYWTYDKELMFSKQTCNSLVGLLQIMSIELTTPIQYGQAFMSYSFSAGHWWEIFPKFKIFFTGLFLVIVFLRRISPYYRAVA